MESLPDKGALRRRQNVAAPVGVPTARPVGYPHRAKNHPYSVCENERSFSLRSIVAISGLQIRGDLLALSGNDGSHAPRREQSLQNRMLKGNVTMRS
jgi:hypothetical protein